MSEVTDEYFADFDNPDETVTIDKSPHEIWEWEYLSETCVCGYK